MLRFLVVLPLVLLASACQAPQSAENVLWQRVIHDGEVSSLPALSHYASVNEISERLKAMFPVVHNLVSANPASCETIAETKGFGDGLAMAFDSTGVLHAVFTDGAVVAGPDYLRNPRHWECHLYYCKRAGGRWTKTQALPDMQEYLGSTRLLVDRNDSLILLAKVMNDLPAPLATGLKPGFAQVVLYRLPKGGQWSEPQYCLAEAANSVHGFDACFDTTGTLHLVWGQWVNKNQPEALWHRICTDQGWQKEEILPIVPGRNLSHPSLRFVDGKLHVIAAGQTPDDRVIGMYHLVGDQGRWTEPALLQDGTSFYHAVSPSGREAVLDAYGRPGVGGGLMFVRFDPLKALAPAETIKTANAGSMQSPGNDLASLGLGPDNRLYLPRVHGGHLFLVRPGAEGQAEAVCLYTDPAAHRLIGQSRLLFHGDTLLVSWTNETGAGDSRRALLRVYGGVPPTSGWKPLPVLLWQLQYGLGLDSGFKMILQQHTLAEARRHDAECDMPQAVERYLYYLQNFGDLANYEVSLRLQDLNRDGILEVRRQLWTLRLRTPAAKDSLSYSIKSLMQSLAIRPDGQGAERILAQPVQDKETVRHLIAESKLQRITVFLAQGQEIAITAEKKKLDEAFMGDCFVNACVVALDGVDPQGAGEREIAWEPGEEYFGGPPGKAKYKLAELATFEIRPQQTNRLNYLIDLHFRGVCGQKQLNEIAAQADQAVPLLLARMIHTSFDDQYDSSGQMSAGRSAALLLCSLGSQTPAGGRVLTRVAPLIMSPSANDRRWGNAVLAWAGPAGGVAGLRLLVPLLQTETDEKVRATTVARILTLQTGSVSEVIKLDAPLVETQTTELAKRLASSDLNTADQAALCLQRIPTPRVTALFVEALVRRAPCMWRHLGTMHALQNAYGPEKLTPEQRHAIVPALIEQVTERDGEGDTDDAVSMLQTTDDRRILPAVFEALEKHPQDSQLQQKAWAIIEPSFSNNPILNAELDKLRSRARLLPTAEVPWDILTKWYKENAGRLVWDEMGNHYKLAP